jgi:hypothetical protein
MSGTLNSSSESNISASPKSLGGVQEGQSAADLVGFYGATPVVQPSGSSQAAVTAVTDGSTGAAAATNGIQPLTATYNSTLLINAIATLAQLGNANATLVNKLRADLVSLGLIKGSA